MAPGHAVGLYSVSSNEATSMLDSTSVLFGLEDEFVVTGLERLSESDLRVVIECRDRERRVRPAESCPPG